LSADGSWATTAAKRFAKRATWRGARDVVGAHSAPVGEPCQYEDESVIAITFERHRRWHRWRAKPSSVRLRRAIASGYGEDGLPARALSPIFSHARHDRMRKVFSVSNFCVNMQITVWRHHWITNLVCYTAGNRINVGGWE
jgi:hypothetical protein